MAGREGNYDKTKGNRDSNFCNVLYVPIHLKYTHGKHVIIYMIKKKKLIGGGKNY